MNKICCFLIAGILTFIFGLSSVAADEIPFKWKDGNTIWYEPSVEQRPTQKDQYNPCEKHFKDNSDWEIDKKYRPFDPPCILKPLNNPSWIENYVAAEKKSNELSYNNSILPPDKRLSDKVIKRKEELLFKDFKNICPKGLELTKSHTGDGSLECVGWPAVGCEKGYEKNGKACESMKTLPCPDNGTLNKKNGLCISCHHGGTPDLNPKRAVLKCYGAGGECFKLSYCRTTLSESKKED